MTSKISKADPDFSGRPKSPPPSRLSDLIFGLAGMKRAGLCVALTLVALSLAPGIANAAYTHNYETRIEGFRLPVAIAFDKEGDVYVLNLEHGAYTVDRFTPGGAAPLPFTCEPAKCKTYVTGNEITGTTSGVFEQADGLAVDQENGDVFVSDLGAHVVDEFSATGEYLTRLTGTPINAPVSGSFGEVDGLVFDQATHDLYVSDRGEVDVFHVSGSTAVYAEQFNIPSGGSFGHEITVNELTEDVYLGGNLEVAVLDPLGGLIPPVWSGAGTPSEEFGVKGYLGINAVASFGGDVYVSSGIGEQAQVVDEFGSSSSEEYVGQLTGSPAGQFDEVHSVAVDPVNGDVYVGESNQRKEASEGVVNIYGPDLVVPDVTVAPASGLTETEATVTGTVNPDEVAVTACVVEYGTTTEYGHSETCKAVKGGAIGAGNAPVEVTARLKELSTSSTYYYRIKAGNANGTNTNVHTVTLTTAGPPVVEPEGVHVVEGGTVSVKVGARVDPFAFLTNVQVEYGPTAAYGSVSAPVSAGSAQGYVTVDLELTNLQPATFYHFRVKAENKAGTAFGKDETFSTYSATPGLPDGRSYELVSLPSSTDAEVYVPANSINGQYSGLNRSFESEGLFQAAADGDGVAYVGSASGPGGNGRSGQGSLANEFYARRGVDGWESEDVQPPGFDTPTYQAFSSDLSVGFLDSDDPSPLSSRAPGEEYDVLYSHSSAGGGYEPLFTVRPPDRTAATFGAENVNVRPGSIGAAVAFAGSSESSEDVLFEANDALLEGSGTLEKELRKDAEGDDGNYLYESIGGRLVLVDVLPTGKVAPGASFGAPNGPEGSDFSHVISADGSRVFWSDDAGEVFVREDNGSSEARTLPVSAAAGARFWTATPDGGFVFYTEGEDLWRFSFARFEEAVSKKKSPAKALEEAREDLSGENAGVQGVIGAGEDGEQVYFVAGGVLATGAVKGQPNLYERDGETTTLIATLSPGDSSNKWEGFGPLTGDLLSGLGGRTAEVTPDGSAVVFMSQASLKSVNFPDGYDNAGCDDNGTPVDCAEVYVYETGGGGGLFCASCDPSGVPPSVKSEGQQWASFLPASWSATYMKRWISASGGRVFFDSVEPLVSTDTNGTLDVYEWERDGEGSCREDTGCVYLLSGGTGPLANASFLVDASESGEDAFFASRSKLSPQDRGESVVLYDARVNGVQPLAEQGCEGTSCQGVPPAPPIFATPSSVTFNGTGNFPPPVPTKKVTTKTVKCKKGFVKKKVKKKESCIKKPKKKTKAGKSASNVRRTGR